MMFDLLRWWYGIGLRTLSSRIELLLAKTFDLFSIELLSKSLFAPFRQIDASGARGSLEVMMRSWFDKLFSRFVGFLIRSATIAVGLIVLSFTVLMCGLWLAAWLIVPLVPLLSIVSMIVGVSL